MRIEVQTVFTNDFGTFQAYGGGLCPSGTTSDSSLNPLFATGYQSNNHVIFHDLKTPSCANGSGTFTALLEVYLQFGASADSLGWNILSGTGAYANLRGTGSFVGSVHYD